MAPDNQAANEDDTLILDAVDRFIERHVEPHAHALEAADAYPEDIVERMKELGLFGATIAPEYGGLGLSAVTYASIVERITEFDIVVISDYGKGVCSERLLRTVIHAADESGVPVIVDPQRGGDSAKTAQAPGPGARAGAAAKADTGRQKP